MAVAAVIFDWGGTLTPWHTIDVGASWLAAVHAGADPQVVEALVRAEEALWARTRDEHRSGHLDEIVAVATQLGVTVDLDGYHAWWEPHTFIDPDAAALFAGLRARKIKIGVLSNTLWPAAVHDAIFARDGVADYIDAAVYTSEIAVTKPHPDAFRAVLDAVGVDAPEDAVFVGDRVFDDIHGARSVGMRTVLVPHSDIPDSQRGHTDGVPDAVITRLADLLPLVDSWR